MIETINKIYVDKTVQDRLAALRAERGVPGLVLRIVVDGGGCSGFQYAMTLTDAPEPEDQVFGGCVASDSMSLDFLKGASVFFEETLAGSAFKIENPNASSGCGCGVSFSVK
ncbi:MAG: iron-sulfur cluster assembly accessory protein [Rhodospirillales bacterium]|nr:iron-sulfur cluster assembly accessory protein [Rhodospirillales bacterium]